MHLAGSRGTPQLPATSPGRRRLTWINAAPDVTLHHVNPHSVMAKLPVASVRSNVPADDVVETSIARVLDAEAAAIAERAREEVRRIGVRTDRRVGAVRAAFEAGAAAAIASFEAEAAALAASHDLSPAEVDRVDRAVRATAQVLTGGLP